MAGSRETRRRVALALARYIDTAPFDELAAHMAVLPDLAAWLGAFIQLQLDEEPSWPDGWVIDDAAPGSMEAIDGFTVRFAGVCWLLTDAADSAEQPFAGAMTLSPTRDDVSSYHLDFGDAVVGVDSRAVSARARREWPRVSRWLYTFTFGDPRGVTPED